MRTGVKMKNIVKVILISFICFLSFGNFALSVEKPKSITIGYMDFDKPPHWFKKDHIGLDLDLVRMAANQLGIRVTFKVMPWKRCEHMLKINQLDGIFGASFKKKRMKIGKYPFKSDGVVDDSAALHMDGYTFYKRIGDPVDYDGNQFIGLTGQIGTNSGFSIVEKLAKKGIKVHDSAKTTVQNVKMLIAGRHQVIVDSAIRVDYVLKKYPEYGAKVVKIPKPYGRSGRYLLFSLGFYKKHPIVAERLFSAIRELRGSKEFKRLQDKAWGRIQLK